MENDFDIDKEFNALLSLIINDKTIDQKDHLKIYKICFAAGAHKALEHLSENIDCVKDIKNEFRNLNNTLGKFWGIK